MDNKMSIQHDIQMLQDVINKLIDESLKQKMQGLLVQAQQCLQEYAWNKYICDSHALLLKNKNSKEIGKVRAYATELMVCDYLNKYALTNNYDTIFIHNDDVENIKLILEDPLLEQQCQSGFDILAYNPITSNVKRIQVKHRNSTIHLETTRRNSAKNASKNKSGHVSYSSDEFDYLCIVRGKFSETVNMNTDLLVFPVSALVNKQNDTILVHNVSKPLEKEYENKLDNMLIDLCT
jgi:hypothetical protein